MNINVAVQLPALKHAAHISQACIIMALLARLPACFGQTSNETPTVKTEVLLVSVSKSPNLPEGFGNTLLFLKISPSHFPPGQLSSHGLRLRIFKDDLDTDLVMNNSKALGNPLLPMNRQTVISPGRNTPDFGVEIRSVLVPAPAATRLIAEGDFCFARAGTDLIVADQLVAVQTGTIVRVGPVQMKFHPALTRGVGTNQTNQTPFWYTDLLLDKGTIVTSFTLSDDEAGADLVQIPDLVAPEPLRWQTAYGFHPPQGRPVRVSIQYYPPEAMVEVPFRIEVEIAK